MDHAIEAHDLAKTFAGGTEALRGVSFAVSPGEVFAYLGRNGQGKTTTVRILSTLTIASRGRASVAGYDVASQAVDVRASIGVTTQAAALDPEMTGREHMDLVAGLWGHRGDAARRRVRDLLEAFSLTGDADRLIRTYSGGMKRRLDLAGALTNRPQVLFLDEPTTGLDVQSRLALWDQVRELRDEGAAVFLTTQYLEEAEALADRVAVIEAGRLVSIDTVAGMKDATGAPSLEGAFLRLTGADAELRAVAVGGV